MQKTKAISQSCIFCEGELLPIYRLKDCEIVQCQNCLSSTVSNYPEESALKAFYSGFEFQIDRKHLSRITTPEIKNWMQSLNLPKNARMLDVGGGAGFFAYAFEHFGLGDSTYIDLDTSACAFAQNELNLKNVTCGDVQELSKHSPNSYDFIYCRHVIEHLVHPLQMIEASIELLKPGGTYILQFPNALSLEYLAYPKRLKHFIKNLQASNGYSFAKALRIHFSRQNALGIDPIRHLWAITPRAVGDYLKNREHIRIETKTASVSDPIYSPYATSPTLLEKFSALVGRRLICPIRGGAHAIVIIRKQNQ